MLLLVGLGNPGASYAGNRHNIGFLALEAIARRHGFGPWRRRFQGELAEGRLGDAPEGARVLALKPMTYMNESGRAVAEACRFYKLTPSSVVVLHDELDLAPGKVKIKVGGGVAGHNGLRSIASHLGPDFKRVRLGIGHPGHRDRVHGWVLSDFAKADAAWLEPLLDAVAAESPLLAAGTEKADGSFMSKVNQAVLPPKARKPAMPEAAAGGSPAGTADRAGGRAPVPDAAPEGLIARALRQARAQIQKKD